MNDPDQTLEDVLTILESDPDLTDEQVEDLLCAFREFRQLDPATLTVN